MCGIVGIVSSEDVNQQIYDSLLLLQHRGQDSTGIATMENTVFHIHKAKGQVNTAYRTRDMRNLIGKIGYLYRTTAVYGSGKFGLADRFRIKDRPEIVGPFRLEMMLVYFVRQFTFDQVNHIATSKKS